MGNPVFLGVPAVIASPAMKQTIAIARRVAPSPLAVLVTGETGSGKEIVARAIHEFSLRSAKPWVDINCGALPEQLMESELFGHEKGAFSGADASKPGLFELAHRGTLFLDEVGELDGRMQVKLLRVLDGAPYYRVGGQKKVAVDVRIVAATNQALEDRVAAGRFRADLYYRLNQCRIRVPPLRERPEDILELAGFFLKQHSEQASLAADARTVLLRRPWPGNVRELKNVIAHAAMTATSYEIAAADLESAAAPAPEAALAGGRFEGTGLRLDGLEREAILEALERTGGQHGKAAELLGISRRTLTRKLKIYRIRNENEYAYTT